MSDPDHFDDEELVSANTQQRNWRGICIALLVIAFVLALTITSVVLLTPPEEEPRIKGTRFQLNEILNHEFQSKRFNGSWVSDQELIFKDHWGGISIINVESLKTRSILSNHTFSQYNPGKFAISPDRKFILLACNVQKLFRYSFLAKYYIFEVATTEVIPLTMDSTEGQHNFFMHVDWAPRGNALILIYNYDIYYKPSSTSSRLFRLTDTAIPGVISNGLPDWLYEEEILSSGMALWMSNDGHLLLHASFNDSAVGQIHLPWYNVNDQWKHYPELRSLRYPRPGTNNPTVSLFVSDLADLENINTREIIPPQGIMRLRDYYFSSASWISLTEVCIVWMNRPQNLSLVTICKSPLWHCQETQRISGEGKGWVEIFPSPLFSPDGKRYVTLAPVRDGSAGFFRHIITVDIQKKRALPLTHGKYQVNKIVAWNHDLKLIYYLGTPESYPGQVHLYSVSSEPPMLGLPLPTPFCITCSSANYTFENDFTGDFDEVDKFFENEHSTGRTNKMERVYTYHNALFSPELSFFVLECLGPDVPATYLYSAKNHPEPPKFLAVLQDNTELKEKLAGKALPRIRTFPVQIAGGYQAQVRLFFPPGLREEEVTKYPLVVQVYGGPGTQLVTDRWKIDWSTFLASNKDYIVAQIDGRGSAGQGYQLMHEVYHRLGTVEVADQLEVTEYLRDAFHFIDDTKIAVWGWSYGGFVASILLAKSSDTFHCGILVAPVTNWAFYDSAYTERYMGLPNVTDNYKGYEESDVSKMAVKFKDKMLYLIHGTADDNVHFQHSTSLIRALASHGILFKQQVYPDEKHSLSGVKLHLYKSMIDHLESCFMREVPSDVKSGLRAGGATDSKNA